MTPLHPNLPQDLFEGVQGPVAVTGASGFIGGWIAGMAARSGLTVRGGVRRSSAAPTPGVERIHVPDACDPAAARRLVDGCATVVHAAGLAHLSGRAARMAEAEYQRVNVGGTETLLDACADAGVRTFVLVSSIAAVGSTLRRIDDETPGRPETAYGRSKLMAEDAVAERARRASIRAAILRAPMVYGAGMKGNPERLLRMVARGVPLPLGRAVARRSMLYVGNLVAAVAFVAAREQAGDGIYLVSDARDMSAAEFATLAARAMGRTPRLVPVPYAMLRALAAPFGVGFDALDRLFQELHVDPRRLRALGFRPPFTPEVAVEHTARGVTYV